MKMKLGSSKFFKALFILTLMLMGAVLLLAEWMPSDFNRYHFLGMIGFLVLLISAVHWILLKVSKGRPQKFIRVFMIATMVKLMLYLGFILTMAYLYRDQAAVLLVGFLVMYMCYTFLEVYFLRDHLNSQGS